MKNKLGIILIGTILSFCGCAKDSEIIVNEYNTETINDSFILEETETIHMHTYISNCIRESTCIEDGVEEYSCVCGDTYTEKINKLEHESGEWIVLEYATCLNEGIKVRNCNSCGIEMERLSISVVEHVCSDWIVVSEASQFVDGEKHKICTSCGQVLTVEKIHCTQVDTNVASYMNYYNEVLRLVNEVRAEAGVAPLVLDENLCIMATKRAVEMNYNNYFKHERPNGETYKTIFSEYNFQTSYRGENIAYGFYTPENVVVAWKASQGHYENMTRPEFVKMGVGYSNENAWSSYKNMWVQLFSN